MTKRKSSKWDEIYTKSQTKVENKVENSKSEVESEVEKELKNTYDAVDTEAEVRYHILNTQIGAMDTKEKVNAQRHNLGPKDTPIENDELNTPKP